MDIIKCLPSQLAQRVFSFDDMYRNAYRVVIAQMMYYHLFNDNTISNLNKYKRTKYSLNKKQKITWYQNVHKTNKQRIWYGSNYYI